MINIFADRVIQFRKCKIPQILFCMSCNEASLIIKENVTKLEDKYKNELHLRALRVNWSDLCAEFNLPPDINFRTMFYLRYGLTIGLIDNPDYNTLEKFFLYCNEVCLKIKKSSLDINKEHFYSMADKINKYNIRIYSPECPIFQFVEEISKDLG